MVKKLFFLALPVLCLMGFQSSSAGFRAVFDAKFPQKVIFKYPLSSEVMNIVVCGEKVFAGTGAGVLVFENGGWKTAQIADSGQNGPYLFCEGGKIKLSKEAGGLPAAPGESAAQAGA